MTSTTLGSPAFALDGNVVGVLVMRAINSKGGGGRNYRDSMTSIILPAEDILKGRQAGPRSQGRRGKEGSAEREPERK